MKMRAIILISQYFSYHMFALYIYRIKIAILVPINQVPLSIHPPLKIIMAFKWSYDVSLYLNFFPSPLRVYVFLNQKKKKKIPLNISNETSKILIPKYREKQIKLK